MIEKIKAITFKRFNIVIIVLVLWCFYWLSFLFCDFKIWPWAESNSGLLSFLALLAAFGVAWHEYKKVNDQHLDVWCIIKKTFQYILNTHIEFLDSDPTTFEENKDILKKRLRAYANTLTLLSSSAVSYPRTLEAISNSINLIIVFSEMRNEEITQEKIKENVSKYQEMLDMINKILNPQKP